MRLIIRTFGLILIFIAIVVGVLDLIDSYNGNGFTLMDVGSLWYSTHPSSLQLLQPAIARYISPFLWDPIMVTILLWPVTSVLGLPGAFFVLLTRRKTRTNKRDLFIR
jgi:hypothetical protein